MLPDSSQFYCLHTHDDHASSNVTNEGNEAGILYSVSKNVQNTKVNALIDGGGNGGIAGSTDSRRMDPVLHLDRHNKVTSIGEHTINDIPIARFCTVSLSQYGNILCIYHEYADGKIQEQTIHSKIQLMDYGNKVDDTTDTNSFYERICMTNPGKTRKKEQIN